MSQWLHWVEISKLLAYWYQKNKFHKWFFHCNSNLMEMWFFSQASCREVITMKFCTWHDSCAAVTCAKFCSDMIPFDQVTSKPIFHRIWIRIENHSWNEPQVHSVFYTQPSILYPKRKPRMTDCLMMYCYYYMFVAATLNHVLIVAGNVWGITDDPVA